jgi:hypothetical protein
VGDAIWHEDIHDPGDMTEVTVELRREGDLLYFSFNADEPLPADTIVLVREHTN